MEIHVVETKKTERKRIRVCAYCRVSTGEEDQANSLENQIEHYENAIRSNPDYEFAGVFYDYGISGYKENRQGFQTMLQKARNHEVDLIITKSVSRLCRNTDTMLKTVRELKELGIGIFFELQGINTLTESGELFLTLYAAFAQAESDNYRQLAKLVYLRKYAAGIPVQYLERSFGYDKNEQGQYIPNPDEAPWVKRIFELCAEGYSPAQIAKHMNDNGVSTKAGAVFTRSTVLRVLENEIYKGDYVMHKNYVDDERRERRNRGEVQSWYIRDDHTPLISRKLWDDAQKMLDRKREYLETGSVVGDLNEETYPYMKQLFCAECGFPLYRRVYSNGNRVSLNCSGHQRYLKKFCNGISIPDSIVRSWGKLPGNVYVRKETDPLGKAAFKYVQEDTWKCNNTKKAPAFTAPELTEENYPYKDSIFCAKCGSKLTHVVQPSNGHVFWACNGRKHKGSGFCGGIRVPDDVVRAWGDTGGKIYIKQKEEKHGERSYSYTRKKISRGKGKCTE